MDTNNEYFYFQKKKYNNNLIITVQGFYSESLFKVKEIDDNINYPPFLMKKILTTSHNNVLYLRDKYQIYFLGGTSITNNDETFVIICEKIKEIILEYKFDKIYLLGASAGGYSGLLFITNSILYDLIDYAYIFSPQINLYTIYFSDSKRLNLFNKIKHRYENITDVEIYDLKNKINSYNGKCKIYIFYDDFVKEDKEQIEQLNSSNNIIKVIVNGGGRHNTLSCICQSTNFLLNIFEPEKFLNSHIIKML